MGQYYVILNLSKRQIIDPHKFGDGAKLKELAWGGLTLTGLAALLADGNGRGLGDLHSDDPVVGSWAGDPIAVVGDYADPDRFGIPTGTPDKPKRNLYELAIKSWEDVSERVLLALLDDPHMRERVQEILGGGIDSDRARLRQLKAEKSTMRGAAEGDKTTKIRGRA